MFRGIFMKQLNRLISLLTCLIVLICSIISICVITQLLPPDILPGGSVNPPTASWFQPQLEALADSTRTNSLTNIAIFSIAGLVSLFVLILELKSPNKTKSLVISSAPEGDLTIEEDSIRYLVEKTGTTSRDIISMRCKVKIERRTPNIPYTISINCSPKITLGSNVQAVRDDLQIRVKNKVETLTGLIVHKVNVPRVKYDRGTTSRL
ncbi:MAG: hypothetical protein CL891_02920 [Dehalococcoidia bacterium]|nr:hypothetical protein [Dehalococcoidia bacterium]